jgi:hypothetical protein
MRVLLPALLGLAAVALTACGDVRPPPAGADIDFSDLPSDAGWIAPVAANLDGVGPAGEEDMRLEFTALMAKYAAWAPARTGAVTAQVFHALNAVALHDMGRGRTEAQFAFAVLRDLRARHDAHALAAAAETILRGQDGLSAVTRIEALALESASDLPDIRARIGTFAKKLLARVTGHIDDATAP